MGILTRLFSQRIPAMRGDHQPRGNAGPKPTPNGRVVATQPPVVVKVVR